LRAKIKLSRSNVFLTFLLAKGNSLELNSEYQGSTMLASVVMKQVAPAEMQNTAWKGAKRAVKQVPPRRLLGARIAAGAEWSVHEWEGKHPYHWNLVCKVGLRDPKHSIRHLRTLQSIPVSPFVAGYPVPVPSEHGALARKSSHSGSGQQNPHIRWLNGTQAIVWTERADFDLHSIVGDDGMQGPAEGMEWLGGIVAASLWLKHAAGLAVGGIKLGLQWPNQPDTVNSLLPR